MAAKPNSKSNINELPGDNGGLLPLDTLAADLLHGCGAIAEFIGVKPRRCFYMLERGVLPARKDGGIWVSAKSVLREHYLGQMKTSASA